MSVDYYGNPGEFLYVLSPTTTKTPAGDMFPMDPSGTCTFLKDGKCSIHAVKPFECQIYDHRKLDDISYHQDVAKAWVPFADKIKELLGREPKAMLDFSFLSEEDREKKTMELLDQLPLLQKLKMLREMMEAFENGWFSFQ